MALSAEAIATLKTVSTATLTTVLLKKGLRNVWIRGAVPLKPGQPRIVGPAFTLRFVLRLAKIWRRRSILGFADLDPRRDRGDAGGLCRRRRCDGRYRCRSIFGDILCARMQKRGVAALVTDGVVRDLA
ncbi:hypothetical protein HB770_30125 (plasmid) [Rhizobium leguminosarum bv. viciae]|uniref:Uncharacterized protein n=1 Tax=Rhizobium leguminosarum bv. viciae TaxID=387 RepID=A0A7G6RN51_RHILV|nr:hypothetical protein HB770_30125 [Rhizobium leguminosarum bv. viciae]